MHHVFQRFVDRLADSSEADCVQKAMAEAAAAFDIPCFAYIRMPRDGSSLAALISTYPSKWTEHYLQHHYERLDPVIQQAHAFTEPFEWGLGADSFPLTEQQKNLFDEANKFGIRCGFTVPIKDNRGPVAAVTFASDVGRPEFRHSIEYNKRALQLMSISLHAHVRRRIWRDLSVNGVRLSRRELECLRFAAEGKSAWDTGVILGLSARTVKFHWDNAKEKLGVRTLRQAVVVLQSARL